MAKTFDERSILKRQARKFLKKNHLNNPDELWKKMADLGWMGIVVPEQYGGVGGNLMDITVLQSEMGYYLLSKDYFSTVILGGMSLLESENETLKENLLPLISSGNKKITLAWMEDDNYGIDNNINVSASNYRGEYRLYGEKIMVPNAGTADYIIVNAKNKQTNKMNLFLLDRQMARLEIEAHSTIANEAYYKIKMDGVDIHKERLLSENAKKIVNKVLTYASVAKTAETLGGAEKVLDLVKLHIHERRQFGRPIGKFQAVQHHFANMLVLLNTLRQIIFNTVEFEDDSSFYLKASICKAWVCSAYRNYLSLAHQIVGGIGFMEEFDLHLFFKHAETIALLYGDENYHLDKISSALDS